MSNHQTIAESHFFAKSNLLVQCPTSPKVQLRQQPPDILVLHRELLWGGSDGVLNMMQQDIAWSTIPVVLLGHREREDELPTCPSTPVIACLESSVAPSVLLATIQKFIRGAA